MTKRTMIELSSVVHVTAHLLHPHPH